MKRRSFLLLSSLSCSSLLGMDFHETAKEAWEARTLNDAALKLYGKEKFATLSKSNEVVIEADKFIVPDQMQIPIRFYSDIKAKSVAIFQTANEQSLVAVFELNENMIIDYTFNLFMEMKGTLFVVIEGIDGKLYYSRHFIDINSMSCLSGG